MHDYVHLRLHTMRTRQAAARAERARQTAERTGPARRNTDRTGRNRPIPTAVPDAHPIPMGTPATGSTAEPAVIDGPDKPRDAVGAGRTLQS